MSLSFSFKKEVQNNYTSQFMICQCKSYKIFHIRTFVIQRLILSQDQYNRQIANKIPRMCKKLIGQRMVMMVFIFRMNIQTASKESAFIFFLLIHQVDCDKILIPGEKISFIAIVINHIGKMQRFISYGCSNFILRPDINVYYIHCYKNFGSTKIQKFCIIK